MKKDIRSLTGIRGIAAVYVMVGHYFSSGNKVVPNSLVLSFINRGYLSVDLFFILSGFLMCVTSGHYFNNKVDAKDYLTFLKKRFSRIYPIYFIVLNVSFILFNTDNIKSYISSILLVNVVLYKYGQILEPIWSLSAEWITYMIFPFLFFLILKFNRKFILIAMPIVAIVILSLISYKVYKLGFYRLLNIVSINGLTKCIADYLIGIVVFLVYSIDFEFKWINSFQIATVLLLIGLLCIPYTDVLIVVLMGALVMSISYGKGIINRVLSHPVFYFLRLISYSVYLIHYFFIYTPYYKNFHFNDPLVVSIRMIAILVTIASASFCYYYIEIPSLNYLRRKLTI